MTTSEVRPMRADAVKNRERILAAAEEVFALQGVAVPIDVVAERAGVGVGTLYRHFPTKEALFEAIVLTRIEHLVEEAGACVGADDPGAAFFGFLREFARNATNKRDLFDSLSAAGIDVKSQCAETFDVLRERIELLLERAQGAGAVRNDVTAPDVIGLVVGSCLAAEQSGLAATSPERMLDVVLDGLRGR
jgi:AcrR family transcriptional regulator